MSGPAARVDAQAKLNLFLRVLTREAGGYHQLATLFQRIALADAVVVRADATGRSLDCRGADTGPAEKNLAWRAATAFAEAAAWPRGFAIEIDKRIPVGGGLGGGSADGAAVLRLLNALAPRPLDRAALASIAFGLGADVPYLLSDAGLAYGTGRGERLTALDPLPAREAVLLVPAFGVGSGEAFGWYAAANAGRAAAAFPPALPPALTWDSVASIAVNDLEDVVFGRHPALGDLRHALGAAGARIARMTGSGSTLFGIFEPGGDPGARSKRLAGAPARLVETRTLERVAGIERLD